MKVTKTSTQPVFQPIELKITIESQEEFCAILNLSSEYYSVPNTLVNEAEIFEEQREAVEEFLKQISSALAVEQP